MNLGHLILASCLAAIAKAGDVVFKKADVDVDFLVSDDFIETQSVPAVSVTVCAMKSHTLHNM